MQVQVTDLWLVRTTIPCHISDNLRQILRVFNNVHMPQHLQMREILRNRGNFQRGDERVVTIQVRDDLEAAAQRNDLSLDMLLQDAGQTRN